MGPARLGRRDRLRKRADFERAYRDGTKVVTRPLVLFARLNGGEIRRLGITATRKIGNAVIRNRARRLVREAYRRIRTEVAPGYDYVVVVRPPLLRRSPDELTPVLAEAIAKATQEAR